jgi:CelD/BcsL family acetyltransferase involved in cellulose biosynthesis
VCSQRPFGIFTLLRTLDAKVSAYVLCYIGAIRVLFALHPDDARLNRSVNFIIPACLASVTMRVRGEILPLDQNNPHYASNAKDEQERTQKVDERRPFSSRVSSRIHLSLEELRQLVPAWDQLLANYRLATTFSTWDWLSSWWQNFAGEQQLFAVSLWDEQTRLVGLAPLSIARQRIALGRQISEMRLMGDGSGDSDNLDMPVLPGFEEEFSEALLRCMVQERKRWDICRFNTLPPDSPSAMSLQRRLTQSHWPHLRYQRVASAITLPETWEEYRQQLSSEDRKNLERYGRRLSKRFNVRIYRCSNEGELHVCLEALFRLHQARWENAGESGSFRDERRQKFYYDLSGALMHRDYLELWALELDGNIAATQYAFRYRDTVFQLQEGFDPERTSDRVGMILRGHVIEQLISQGVRKYDFLGGEPGYKARWSAKAGYYLDLHLARPFTVGSAYLRMLHSSMGAKEWLRAHLPAGAWDLLHRTNVGLRRRAIQQGGESL